MPMQVGFLFNHYEPHQVAHSAPVAFALSQRPDAPTVTIFCSNPIVLATVVAMAAAYPEQRCRIVRLQLPPGLDGLARWLSRWWPIHKQLVLRLNARVFRPLQSLVVPERTSLKLKRDPRLRHIKLIRIRHGAGDRATGLDASNDLFDLILASGQKMIDRLIAVGVDPAKCRIIGYPKFDYAAQQPPPSRLFANDRPVVLYNPHFKPAESSWSRLGLDVLAFFKAHPDYNLIFAPHIMLQRQPEFLASALAPYRACPNIKIDLGSTASIDMTYTRAADIYLGDVSSQVYEFLQQPRPCIFLNAHAGAWQGDPNYAVWQAGPVLNDVSALAETLAQAEARQPDYAPIQRQLFTYTFDLTAQSSTTRAATAVAAFVAATA